MGNIKVSVIIPVYNTAPYLIEAIQSILNQTLKEIEIITINDGSTDNSESILIELSYIDSRIKVISFKKNAGLSSTRNIGLRYAQGEFIYFFDSDDILEIDCLELCYKKLKDTNAEIVIFDGIAFVDNGIKSDFRGNYSRTYLLTKDIYIGSELMSLLLWKKSYSPSVCLYISKKSYLEDLQLSFLDGVLYEDVLYTTQLFLSAKRISFCSRFFFHRRIRANSIMTTKITKKNIYSQLIIGAALLNQKHLYQNKISHKIINYQVLNRSFYLIKIIIYSGRLWFLLRFGPSICKLIIRSL